MKNSTVLALLTALLLVPLSSSAQVGTEQAACNQVTSAADAGRTRAIDRLSSIEQAIKTQITTSNICQERFGDIASRVAVTIGGFDVAPIRDAIFQKACDVISSQTGSILSQIPTGLPSLSDLANKIPGLPPGSIPSIGQLSSLIPNYGQLPSLSDLTRQIPGLTPGSIPTIDQLTSQIPNYAQLPSNVQQQIVSQLQQQIQQQVQQQVGAPQPQPQSSLWDRIANKLTSW